jgi:membrane protease YdiL (CAAX protease family)
MLGLLVAAVASVAGALAGRLVTDQYSAELVLSQLGLWFGMIGAVVFCGRRYGTGRLRHDYQVDLRGVDTAIGLGLSVAARIAAGVVTVVVLLLLGTDTDTLPNQVGDEIRHSHVALAITVAFVVLGAPVVEELYFRGLLMRSLEPSLKPAGAIAVQAVIFGSLHANADATWQQNVALMSALAVVGAGLGLTAYVSKRLSIGMWTHALFNLVAAIVLVVD